MYPLRALLNAKKTCFVDEALYHYVQHDASMIHEQVISDKLIERLKIPESLTEDEKDLLNRQFADEFEYFKLLTIQRCVHGISAVAKYDRKAAKQLLRKVLSKDVCRKIMKNKFSPWHVKIEFFVIKIFGIGFHLSVFPLYQLMQRVFRG